MVSGEQQIPPVLGHFDQRGIGVLQRIVDFLAQHPAERGQQFGQRLRFFGNDRVP